MIMRRFILGVDRQGQCLNGAQMQLSHPLGLLLLVTQPAQVDAVRAFHHVGGRQQQNSDFPAQALEEH